MTVLWMFLYYRTGMASKSFTTVFSSRKVSIDLAFFCPCRRETKETKNKLNVLFQSLHSFHTFKLCSTNRNTGSVLQFLFCALHCVHTLPEAECCMQGVCGCSSPFGESHKSTGCGRNQVSKLLLCHPRKGLEWGCGLHSRVLPEIIGSDIGGHALQSDSFCVWKM